MKKCIRCGKMISDEAMFCPECGKKQELSGGLDEELGAAASTYVKLNQTQRSLREICGGILALLFCIGFTVNLLHQVITSFSLVSAPGYIMSIILCVGMWMIYVGCHSNELNVTGFSMINVIVTIDLVLWTIVGLLLVIAGIYCIGHDAAAAGLVLFIFAFLLIFYWFALRKTTHETLLVVKGQGDVTYSSYYPIVMIFASVAWQLIAFAMIHSITSTVSDALWDLNLYGTGLGSWMDELLVESGMDSYYYYGYDTAATWLDSLYKYILSALGIYTAFFSAFLSIFSSVCAALLLIKLRNCGKASGQSLQ